MAAASLIATATTPAHAIVPSCNRPGHWYGAAGSGTGNYGTADQIWTWSHWSVFDPTKHYFSDEAVWSIDANNTYNALEVGFFSGWGADDIGGDPNWSNGISALIMYGRYRAQDDALARGLGYVTGKWPLLPYQGSAVSNLPHGIFETYEEIYQFRSSKAAATWLDDLRATPNPNDIPGLLLPPSFIARSEVMGSDNGLDEHEIAIGGQHGNELIFVSFRGGKKLAWNDINKIWSSAYSLISKTFAP